MHRNVLREAYKIFVACDEVGLAIDFNEYADTPVVNVATNDAFGSNAVSALSDGCQVLLLQVLFGLRDITTGFHESLFAVHHASAGLLTERGHLFS